MASRLSPDAVIFDLFGTLVPEIPRSIFYETAERMAVILGADPTAFRAEWDRTGMDRQKGAFEDGIAGNVRAICATLEMPEPSATEIEAALAPREAMYRRWFHPRVGAVEVLLALRARGVPTALISMCAPDTPAMWHASPLGGLVDVEVFSCEVGCLPVLRGRRLRGADRGERRRHAGVPDPSARPGRVRPAHTRAGAGLAGTSGGRSSASSSCSAS